MVDVTSGSEIVSSVAVGRTDTVAAGVEVGIVIVSVGYAVGDGHDLVGRLGPG